MLPSQAMPKNSEMAEHLFPKSYLRNRRVGCLSLALTVCGSISVSAIMEKNWWLHAGTGLPVWKEHGIYEAGILLLAGVLLSLLALNSDHEYDFGALSLCIGIIATCTLSIWIFLL